MKRHYVNEAGEPLGTEIVYPEVEELARAEAMVPIYKMEISDLTQKLIDLQCIRDVDMDADGKYLSKERIQEINDEMEEIDEIIIARCHDIHDIEYGDHY